MRAVLLRRTGRGLRLDKSFQTSLSLDPLTTDPELVGREIRNHLTDHGIRERRCVICVPLKWALTLRTALPALAEEDIHDFLTVQAEREFPFAPEDISLSVSRFQISEETEHATVVAIPKSHLTALQNTLKAARLRPVGITLGISSLRADGTRPDGSAVSLLVGEEGIDLGVSAGGGMVSLRALDDAYVDEPAGKIFDTDSIVRQIRVTLGQLPPGLSETVNRAYIFGCSELSELLIEQLRPSLDRLGMSVDVGCNGTAQRFIKSESTAKHFPPVLSATAQYLLGRPPLLEFLPPKTSRIRQITGRVSSRRTLLLGSTVLTLLAAAVGSFSYQYWKLSSLESRWSAIEPNVIEAEAVQQQVRTFRPWYDDSVQSLSIVQRLTEAFPEEGSVWTKTVEIKEQSEVHCSGFAQSNREWLRVLDRLGEADQIQDLQVQQVRGEDPLQFALSFYWNKGLADGS